MKFLLAAINSKYIHSNLAVHSLKAYCGRRGQDVLLKEFTVNQPVGEVIAKIYLEKPDVVAFSVYIWNVEQVKKAAGELKKLLPQVKIWAGGPEVSYESGSFLEENQAFDGVMRGEGEESFYRLTQAMQKGEPLEQIPSVTFRQGQEIEETAGGPCVEMDALPFVYEDMTPFANKIIYYESSRGCPFGCSYCLSSVERGVRYKSLSRVFEEIGRLLKAGVSQIKFVDRTFNANPARTCALLEWIIREDNGVTNFHFEAAADLLTGQELELLERMRPGLVQLEIGVQSTHAKTIEAVNRTMNLEKVKQVVNRLQNKGNIHIHLDLIAGLPYEDLETFKKSFDEVYAMKPQQLQLGFLKVLKGSPLKRHAEEYGIVFSSIPPYEVLRTRWLSYEDLLELKQTEEMTEIYYNSGQYRNSLAYLEKFFARPYELYHGLAKFYEAGGHFEVKHARMETCRLFRAFALTVPGVEGECLDGLLTLDLYLREKLKSRPPFALPVSREQKEQIRRLFRLCQISGEGHIEPLPWAAVGQVQKDVKDTMRGGPKAVYAIFDYSRRNPLTHEAEVRFVRGEENGRGI